MRVEVGWLDVTYGTIADGPDGICYDGPDVEGLHALVERVRRTEEALRGRPLSDRAVLRSLLEQRRGYTWARVLEA